MPSSNKNSEIQYKSAPQGAVNLDEAQGIVECFVAGIGNKDSVGDVCAPGAFGKSLIRRKPRVVWGHNWNDPIGKVLDMYEVPPSDARLPGKMKAAGIGGLYARVQFNLKSEKGREAFANVAFFGEEQEWSIGYKTINAKFDPQMQANILYEVELYEVSPVLHGANQLTGTISIKSEEQPSNVLVNEQKPVDGLNVNELSSVLNALKTIATTNDEKCGPGMPMPMAMPMNNPGMPSGGPGMPSAQQPSQSPAPRNVVKPEVPSMPENPMLVAIRRELVNRTGSNIIVRSAVDNVVVFDRITSDGISTTYKLPFYFANDEFMFGKPEKVNMQITPESNTPEMPGMPHNHGAYEATPAFEAGKSLLSFDDSSWGTGFNQQIPSQQVDLSTLNNVINNLEKIIDENSTYIIPVDVESAFAMKQAIDPILDYYRVDATVTEDGIIVKSLDSDFLDAMDIATKGVLRSIGNAIGRGVDRPNIGGNRRNRTPNLASRGPGIGSRGAVVKLRDGSTWDPKNAPDRNRNGIVGEGLFDSSGRSLAQPDPTPEGPDSVRGTNTPKAPKAPERLSSGRRRPSDSGDWDDRLEPEERARQMGKEWMGGPSRYPSRPRRESTATYTGEGLTPDERKEILDSVKGSSNPLVQKLLADMEENGRLSDKQWEVLNNEFKKNKKKARSGYVSDVRGGGTVAPGAKLDGGNVDLSPDHENDTNYENLRDSIEKAMRANQMIRFDYSGKNREIIPVKIEKNNKTGKWNLTGQDNTGARKLFSLDKMSPFTGERLSSGEKTEYEILREEAIDSFDEMTSEEYRNWKADYTDGGNYIGPGDSSGDVEEMFIEDYIYANTGSTNPNNREMDFRKTPKSETRLSSGEWTRNADGEEMDAPDIQGVYDVIEGLDGKFYVTRYSDFNRNGGQNAQEYEHDKPFASLAAAKKWVEKDYAQAAEEYMPYGMEDAYSEDDERLSSGAISKIEAINLPEMPHDEPYEILRGQYDDYEEELAGFFADIEKVAREFFGDKGYESRFGNFDRRPGYGGGGMEGRGWEIYDETIIAERYKEAVIKAMSPENLDNRLSSGKIDFDKIGASGLKEMRHVERNPLRYDTQAEKDAREAYEKLVANFRENNGFFMEVPMYAGDKKWHGEEWFRGREMANNVAALRFEEPSMFGTMQFFDKPGMPSKKEFFERKTTVDYRNWYMHKVPSMTQELDMVLASDLYSDEYKEAYLEGIRTFLYVNRPDTQYMPRDDRDRYEEWMVRSGLGWKGRYDNSGPKMEDMDRLSSGAKRGTRKDNYILSYDHPEDLKEAMLAELIANNLGDYQDVTAEDLAYAINVRAENVEPLLDEVKEKVRNSIDAQWRASMESEGMTVEQMDAAAADIARSMTVADKFAGMTDAEAADYAEWLDGETWRDRDDRFSSGESYPSTPEGRAAKYKKDRDARNLKFSQMTDEEARDYAEYMRLEDNDDRLSSGSSDLTPAGRYFDEIKNGRGRVMWDDLTEDEQVKFGRQLQDEFIAERGGNSRTRNAIIESGMLPELTMEYAQEWYENRLVIEDARPSTPEERVKSFYKAMASRNAVLERLTREELAEVAEYQKEETYNPRLSSGVPNVRSVIDGEPFIGRDNAGHYWYAYDPEDDFENIDDDIVKALFKPIFTPEEYREEIEKGNRLDGATAVQMPNETGANARRVAEAVANNTSIRPSLKNQAAAREDVLHFNYNGRERSVFPEKFATSKKGDAYFVAWDPTAKDGSGEYRSFNIDKIEGLVSGAIHPEEELKLSSGKSKARGNRGDGKGRGRPWSAEDRQRFADGNVLRSQARPGRRREGPSAGEFSSNDRLSSGAFYYERSDEYKNRAVDWEEDGDTYEVGYALDRNIESDENIAGLFDSSEQETMAQYGDEGVYYGNSSRGRYDPQNDFEASIEDDDHSPEDGSEHIGKAVSVTDEAGNKLYGVVVKGWEAEYDIDEPDPEYGGGGPGVSSSGGIVVLATHDADGSKLDKPVVVTGGFGVEDEALAITNADEAGKLRVYGPRINVSKGEVSEETFDEAQKLYNELDPFANGSAVEYDREYRNSLRENRLSSGARFTPEGESNSRLQRRLSSGDVKGPPPTGSGDYNREKQVRATMQTFHTNPGNAVVGSDTTDLLGPLPKGKNSHIISDAAAKRIIENPDMEYSAENGWPVDAGKLLDLIEVNEPDAIVTLRQLGEIEEITNSGETEKISRAQRIAKILGVTEGNAQKMLEGKPVYINSSTAADMFDRLERAGVYPDSVGGFNDVARVWGFDGAPKWVRHSDFATPEFDLDENDMVNWSTEKWDGLTRAEFDAEVRRGKNPPEPVYVSPVEHFNSAALLANPKWDARGGSFRNPTVDSEFAAQRKPLERAEQFEPAAFRSQTRVGESTKASDKAFLENWTSGNHGITSSMLMEILGIERQSDKQQLTNAEIISIFEAINESKAKTGLGASKIPEPSKLSPTTAKEWRNNPVPDEVLNALVLSGRFKSMREMVAPLGNSRLDSLAAEYDSRMLIDAAVIRIKDKMNQLGFAGTEKELKEAITAAFGRKIPLEKRMKEGRVSIKGQMTQDAMFGDERVSELLETVNESLAAQGFPPIDKDELFPKDENGGFIDNLSSTVPGAQRMSSGQRFVARTSSSRRADAGMDAAARRATDRPRFSSGETARPLRDENGRIVPSAMVDLTLSGIKPKSVIERNTGGQNLEDFEKAVKIRAQIAEMFNRNTGGRRAQGFSVYDMQDDMIKAGFSEEEAEELVDKIVDLDDYIDEIEAMFSEANDVIENSIEEIEDSLEKINRLKKEREDLVKRYGEEDGQSLLEVIDEKIANAMKKVDNAYQAGLGNDANRIGTLYPETLQILRDNPAWTDTNSPMEFAQTLPRRLIAVEAAIAKAGGKKKAVPVTGIDFGVPEGTRLSSGKSDEYFQNLTSHLIDMIEKSQKDGGKWEAPWHKAGNLPRNASTKNMYSGGNLFALMLAAQEKGYTTPNWGGFQQWKSLGGTVKKGEKATVILMPKPILGDEIDPETGQKRKVSKGVYFVTGNVFNLDQIEGIDREKFLKMPTDALTPEQRVTKLEDAIKEVGATIMTGDGSRAYYSPREDHVVMPPFELFKSPEGYYGTLAHELVHWTGHSSRLDRNNMNQFGSPDYAREELVAEFGSAFLLAMFGLSAAPREDHAHYLANWLKVLRDEPNALQEASIKAQAASKLLIDKMQAVLAEMGETASDVESEVEVKSFQIFNDPLYEVKDALIDWAKDPLHAPFLVKSLGDRNHSSGLVNRSWERIAETAIFLERLSRKK